MHRLTEGEDDGAVGDHLRPDAASAAEIRRLATEMLPHTGAVAAAVLDAVLLKVPELVPSDTDGAMAVALESTEQNIGVMLSTLAFSVTPTGDTPPPATVELLRTIVAAGGDITVLFSAYRAGHRRLWELWSEHVADRMDSPELEREVLDQTSDHFFTFIDQACRALLGLYRDEYGEGLPRVPVADDAGATRRELIDSLLTNESVDQQRVRITLGYELGAHHTAAVFIPLQPDADIQSAVRLVHVGLGAPAQLTRVTGDGTWWAWFGSHIAPAADDVRRLEEIAVDDVIVGVGASAFGLQGFRRSHGQVAELERMARMSQAPRPGVILHEDIALAALLCVDEIRAARFATEHLGAIADPGEAMARHTLSVFLACGRSKVRAAERLHVHQKTVTYRLARAEELLGHAIDDHACELEAALRIHFALFGN